MKKRIILTVLTIFTTITSVAPVSAFVEYNPENVDLLAHVIMGEAEGGSLELKLDVGSVVLNRVEDDRFEDTLEDVIFEEGQYECTWNGRWELEPSWECREAAAYLLEHGSQLDEECVWQATFFQGTEIVKYYEGTYFCK